MNPVLTDQFYVFVHITQAFNSITPYRSLDTARFLPKHLKASNKSLLLSSILNYQSGVYLMDLKL